MPTLTVKNIPDDIYERLKKVAEQHRRSLNSELIHCLEKVLMPEKMSTSERIRAARAVRPKLDTSAVSHEEIMDAIDQSRP